MAYQKLKEIIRSPQLQNIASMLGAEAVSKLSRIVTLMAMAAFLLPVEYGTAMLALACHDMIRLMLRCGAGSQLVQCSDQQLPEFARNGAVIQWILCSCLALLQYAGANLIATFYDNPALADILKQLSLVYFCYPLVSVRVFLIQRSNKLRYFGFCNGLCVSVENLSIAAFLYSGAGIEAVVYGKYIYGILWVLLFSIASVKTYGIACHLPTVRHLVGNSFKLFQSEFSRSLRMNADIFIAGKLLPAEIFGIYSFAKSASIAISQAVSNAVVCALYPQFCQMYRDSKMPDPGLGDTIKQRRLIIGVTAAMLFCYLCQAALAPVYIPLFFADTWTASIYPAVLLCFSAMPVFLLDMLCSGKRAMGEFAFESKLRLGHLLTLLSGLLLSQPDTPEDFALAVLLAGGVWLFTCLTTIALKNQRMGLLKNAPNLKNNSLSPSTSGEKL